MSTTLGTKWPAGKGPTHRREKDTEGMGYRLDIHSPTIGFQSNPPCRVELKFFRAEGAWSAYTLTGPGNLRLVLEWLEGYDCNAVHVASGVSPRVARVGFGKLPGGLERLLTSLNVHNISLMQGPVACVLVFDTRRNLARFIDGIESQLQNVSKVGAPRTEGSTNEAFPWVTPRQKDAMALAVALGYYDVPHRIGLRELAKQMGLSLSSVSELLRRAESVVLRSYTTQVVQAEWTGVQKQRESIEADENVHEAEAAG